MSTTPLALLTLAAVLATSAAQDCGFCPVGSFEVILDFEGFVPGDVLNDDDLCFGGLGVNILNSEIESVLGTSCIVVSGVTAGGIVDRAMIFNSNCSDDPNDNLPAPTGGDPDLCVGPDFGNTFQGLTLIISEDGDSSDPDDNGSGGIITFDFSSLAGIASVQVFSASIIDIDSVTDFLEVQVTEVGSGIPITFDKGAPQPMVGDNSQRLDTTPAGPVPNAASLQVSADVSFAVGDIRLCVTPEERCVGNTKSADGVVCCDATVCGDICGGCTCDEAQGPGSMTALSCCPSTIIMDGLVCMTPEQTGCVLDPECIRDPVGFGNCDDNLPM
eukprot:scaffold1659_cov255-Pinguiococcus_pyrenoidosus.AAC.21